MSPFPGVAFRRRCGLMVAGMLGFGSGLHAADGIVPAKAKTVPAVFPLQLIYQGRLHGQAMVALEVDESGKLSDALVVAHTHPAFAQAAVESVRKWTFTPTVVDGIPVLSRIDVLFEF